MSSTIYVVIREFVGNKLAFRGIYRARHAGLIYMSLVASEPVVVRS
jgi:hypothetical protein